MRLVYSLLLVMLSYIASGQLKDFSQYMLISRYGEPQIVTFLRSNRFEFVGKDYNPDLGHKVSFWSYDVEKLTEGGIGYFAAANGRLVLLYVTIDPVFLLESFQEIENYGFTLEKKIQKKKTETSYVFSYKKTSLIIRIWKEEKGRMIMFMVGDTDTIAAVNQKANKT